MKTIENDGWTFDCRPNNMDLFSIPSETINKAEGYWVYLSHIAYSKGLTRRVYFVDVWDNNAWITLFQFKNEVDALKKLYELIQTKHGG